MMLRTVLGPAYVWEAGWAAAFAVMLLTWLVVWRSARRKRKAGTSEIEPAIVDALSIYLGGNSDTTVLRGLAATHPNELRETILQYQTVLAGQCDGLCELAITLGYVQSWWYDTQSSDVLKRRQAFSHIASMACYEPVRRLVGDVIAKSFNDRDEQIRIDVFRILLASEDIAEITRVFEAVIVDTPRVRSVIGPELAQHSVALCESAVPWALRAENPMEVLKMLLLWERGLALTNVRGLTKNPDPTVRREAMNLLRYLPATAENLAALRAGMSDDDGEVREAAAASIRLGRPNDETPGAGEGLSLVRTGATPDSTPNSLENWRMLDAQNES
jgi:hypothetical protein